MLQLPYLVQLFVLAIILWWSAQFTAEQCSKSTRRPLSIVSPKVLSGSLFNRKNSQSETCRLVPPVVVLCENTTVIFMHLNLLRLHLNCSVRNVKTVFTNKTHQTLQFLFDESNDLSLCFLNGEFVGCFNSKIQLSVTFFWFFAWRIISSSNGDASFWIITYLIEGFLQRDINVKLNTRQLKVMQQVQTNSTNGKSVYSKNYSPRCNHQWSFKNATDNFTAIEMKNLIIFVTREIRLSNFIACAFMAVMTEELSSIEIEWQY